MNRPVAFGELDRLCEPTGGTPAGDEIPWEAACAGARSVIVRHREGVYDVLVEMDTGEERYLVPDNSSRKFMMLDRRTATFTAWVLALRRGLAPSAIRFLGPDAIAVERERLLAWARQCPGTRAAREMTELADYLALPWSDR